MFWNKKMKAEIADLQAFEKGVCKIIDGYFATNEKAEVRYSMDNGVDKFWHFVKSVNDRISKFEKALADGELVSKEWHDEQVGNLQAEIERLTEENGYLDGCAKQFLADYQKCEIDRAELQNQVEELTEQKNKNYLKGEIIMKDEKTLLNEIKEQCGDCEAWSGTDCTRNPYTQGCLKDEKQVIECHGMIKGCDMVKQSVKDTAKGGKK